MLILSACIVLAAIFLGVQKGGFALPLYCFVGLGILSFFCGISPTSPPYTVMMIMFAVTTLGGCLQCTGGMDYLVNIASRILRRHPNHVTIIAPLITFMFTVCTGTAQIVMALLPVISEVARKAGVRPERPLGASCAAATHGIMASPLSAAMAAWVGYLSARGITFGQMMMVLFPALTLGVLCGALSVYRKGKDLSEDPEFLHRVEQGLTSTLSTQKTDDYRPSKQAKVSVIIFLISIALILFFGAFGQYLPHYQVNGKETVLSISVAIQIISLTAAGILVFACGADPKKISETVVFKGGVYAVFICFGVAFLTDSFFNAFKPELIAGLGGFVQAHPWTFAVALMFMSAILMSQGATTFAMLPLGLTLGIPAPMLLAMAPAINATYILPVSPSLITAVALDSTGTTTLGKWMFDHSAERPGLVTTISSLIFSFLLVEVLL